MAVDRDKILHSAQKLVDKKRYDKAIVEYRKLIAEDPGDVRTLLKIGDLHLKLDDHEPAIKVYEQVGEFYYREGFSVKAIAVYKQIRGIIKRHAAHLEGRYGHIVPRLAEIYTQLGLTSDALAAYDEVATRLRQEGRERDALDIFKKVVELDPQNPIAHLRVADSRARLGDIDKAVERFAEAAEIMVRLGRVDDALKVLERLLEYRQDPTHARRAGQLYLERSGPNDGMAALSKLQIAFKANPKDLDTLAMLATAFDVINQPKKAVEVLKESARIAKDSGDRVAFDRLLTQLLERAPEDTLVGRLDQWRNSQGAGPPSIEVGEEILVEESAESIEEVFELDEDELEEAGERSIDAGTFGAGGGEGSAVRRLIGEAERRRAAGQLALAIQLLRDGLRNLGRSPQLRHKLSDVLLESGDQAGSITEKLILAQELANQGHVEPALEMLDEVLLLQPGQPDAVQMRANLGFPVSGYAVHGQGIDDLQLNQPLQSYDVESGGVEEALHRSRHHSAHQIPAISLDDPFASSANHPALAPPPPMAQRIAPAVQQHYAQGHLDEDALDQADNLADQGRFDEARMVLHSHLHALPNHPLILERLADIDAMATQAGHTSQSGPYPVVPPQSQPIPLPAQDYGRVSYPEHDPQVQQAQQAYEQQYSQQGQEQQAYEQQYSQQGYPQQYSQQGYPQQYSQQGYEPEPGAYQGPQQGYPEAPAPQDAWASEVDSLLDQVRVGVKNQVAESDAATHYDLGVAYYEMGLHSDAISELTLATRDPSRECVCLSMIGTIQLQVGDYDAALDALQRALYAQYKTADQEVALGYEIANTYELKMMLEQALHYFEWLANLDPNYEDPRGSVSERIQRLRTESGAQPRPRAPAFSPDASEMDGAFDDLFEKGRS